MYSRQASVVVFEMKTIRGRLVQRAVVRVVPETREGFERASKREHEMRLIDQGRRFPREDGERPYVHTHAGRVRVSA